LPICKSSKGGKIAEIDVDLVLPDDNAFDQKFKDTALLVLGHTGPGGVKVNGSKRIRTMRYSILKAANF
jgi:hypothetical protein